MQHFNLQNFMASRLGADDFELNTVIEALPQIGGGVWLAGGAVRDTLSGTALSSDIDLFFKNSELFKVYRKKLEDMGAVLKRSTDSHKTFTLTIEEKEYEIQLIHIAYHPSVEALLDSFDFTICQFATDGKNLYSGDYSLFDLARKRIAIHKITFGVSSMRRLIKYTNKGFYACSGCLTEFLTAVADDRQIINSDVVSLD